MDDVTLKIGGDNTPLENELDETKQLFKAWAKEIQGDAFDKLDAGLDNAERSADKIQESLNDIETARIEKIEADLQKAQLAALAIGVAIAEAINNAPKSDFGLNSAIQLAEKLRGKIEEINELGTKRRAASSGGDLAALNEQLDAATKNVVAKEIEKQKAREPSFSPFVRGTDSDPVVKQLRAAEDLISAQNELKIIQEAIVVAKSNAAKKSEEESKQQAKAAEEVKKSQAAINAEIEKTIALNQEASQRASGDIENANKSKLDREQVANRSRFEGSGLSAQDSTDAAMRIRKSAEDRIDAENAQREDRKIQREEQKREGLIERLARKREQLENNTRRGEDRIESIENQKRDLIRKMQRPLGGFDSGFAGLSDRISANFKGSGASPEVNQLNRLNDKAAKQLAENKRQNDVIIESINKTTEAIGKINAGMS